MESRQLQICVVAHNEERHIHGCLASIEKAISHAELIEYSVHIINNGSSDDTQKLCESFCRDKPGWFGIEISVGDKANAWNTYVYQFAAANVLTVFIDGDCKMSEATLKAFIEARNRQPEAYIYAAIPITHGNTSNEVVNDTLADKGLSGNLYALSECFIKQVRDKEFGLPVGLIGDDSLLAWVSSHNFKLTNGFTPGFLVGVGDARYEYHRLTPTSWSNVKLYVRRLQRYSLRHLQQCCIRSFLDEHDNFEKLPATIDALYPRVDPKFIRKNTFLNRIFDERAYRHIQQLPRIPD
jgi:glycosyltransferase involved in cell wall biosynthesis